ncbi:ABC transporter substrate-binding protein [Paenarthrobacter sp. Z7-10]|uniref:ABC transporter substrate-binding protein n=1 Tax=Paenarthrobacter sp. Z7-10 TaxID=2787635 RepID=UPI0022A94E92|nr:ABC transporter substrate-binding protein [Paenarthrobacter sp. Z7-10]MCZ2402957.1 ABC transporter substrate-binding protein [Paenarthrobacter sp. Z7-10]
MKRLNRLTAGVFIASLAVAMTGCAPMTPSGAGADADAGLAGGSPAKEVRIGYFPNPTHGPAIVGVRHGFFAKHLGQTTLKPLTFNAGPAAIEALFSSAVDMAFVGPNPTVNGYAKSKGTALRVVAGAASGGAGLVVRTGISSVDQLRGARLATPQLGNTQDVALRHWLKDQDLSTDSEGGGDVHILPQDNATALQAFASGHIDGAWLPEPWMTRLIQQGGAHLLVNEKDLWPEGKFVVTNLVVRKEFLDQHPQTVAAVLEGELDALDFINSDPASAKEMVNAGIKEITGQELAAPVLESAWGNVGFTYDPLAATLITGAGNAQDVGLLAEVNLSGLYDLNPLDCALTGRGKTAVVAP